MGSHLKVQHIIPNNMFLYNIPQKRSTDTTSRVTLVFHYIDLEAEKDCKFDYIMVFDGKMLFFYLCYMYDYRKVKNYMYMF